MYKPQVTESVTPQESGTLNRDMAVGDQRQNMHPEVSRLDLRLASPVSFQSEPDHGINAMFGRGMKYES
jgi:hypothetical protein